MIPIRTDYSVLNVIFWIYLCVLILMTGKSFIFLNCTTWHSCNFAVSPQDGNRVNLQLIMTAVNGDDGALKNITTAVAVRCTFNHCSSIQTHCVILYYYIYLMVGLFSSKSNITYFNVPLIIKRIFALICSNWPHTPYTFCMDWFLANFCFDCKWFRCFPF